jgi:2-(acetamidomethylene)succinate hydrolase
MPSDGGWERRRRPGRGVALSTLERGDGPPCVLLHGITANARVWEPVGERLAERYHVVAVDQRGHGQSDKPETGYAAADFVADVRALLADLGGEPALVVGHSMGARNALATAARHPDRVSACVAIDFGPGIEPAVFDALDTRIAAGPDAFADEEAVRRYLTTRYPTTPAEAIARRIAGGYRRVPDGRLVPWAGLAPMAQAATGLREPLEPDVLAVRVPALVLRGSRSWIVSDGAFAAFQALRPDFTFAEAAGVSHYVHEEAPEWTSAQVEAFDAARSGVRV